MDKMAGVVMQEENRRFSADRQRAVSGQITMQKRAGMIRIKMEAASLRQLDKNRYTYRLMLLGLKDGHSLHRVLGDFQAEMNGTAKGEWEIPAADIDGKGNCIEDFFVFMVVAVSLLSRGEPYHPVMKGDWDRRWLAEPLHQKEPEGNAVRNNYNDFYKKVVAEKTARLIAKREACRTIKIFDAEWMAENWMIADDPEDFPVASITASECIKTGGHFLFAFNDEFLLLGLPGSGEKEMQPDGGASGFNVWQPAKGSALHGYWLTAVRRETGEIVGI